MNDAEVGSARAGGGGTHGRRRARWMLPALLAVAVGCAGGAWSLWSPSAAPAATTSAPGSTPVIAGALPQQDLATVSLADQMLLQSCMRGNGFRYSLFGTGGTRSPATPSAPFDQSVAQAEAHGYGGAALASSLHGNQPPDLNARYMTSLSPAELARYETAAAGSPGDRLQQRLVNGSIWSVPDHGCQADAYVRLYGSLTAYARYFTFSAQVTEAATQEAAADPAYRSAQRAWVGCVRAQGFQAADPTDLMDQALAPYAQHGANLTAVRKHETAMAVAAARCNASTGLEAAFTRAEQGDIDRLVALNSDSDADYARTGLRALAAAKTVVADYRTAPSLP
ncbi:hypothetical protein ABH940_003556 [Streptacidiphilus sp. BW17]|uniref:hypothetical protein n=1 Tax=Streptacidiphilus sp. BW17 TaxID=3156274 RepID=UPI003512E02E